MVRVIGIGIQFFFRGMAADRAVFIDVDILAPEPDTHVLTGTLPFRLQRLHTQIQKLLQLFHSLKELIGVQVILLQFVHHGCDLVNCLTEFFVGLIETVTVFLNYGFNCRQDLFLVNLSLRNLVDDFSFNRRYIPGSGNRSPGSTAVLIRNFRFVRTLCLLNVSGSVNAVIFIRILSPAGTVRLIRIIISLAVIFCFVAGCHI